MTPAWVVEAAAALALAIVKLITAESPARRHEALMEAAEATKAGLDRIKFGEG